MSGTGSEERTVSPDPLRRLRNIDPDEFENFVGELWEQQGWETTVSPSSNDVGVDVVAKKTDGMVNQKVAILVERDAEGNRVGRDEVQQHHATKVQDGSADAAVVVTTSTFTAPAEEWATEHDVDLVDGEDLVAIIRDNDAFELLNQHAPVFGSADVDPASEPDTGPKSLSLVDSALPDLLANDDKRRKLGIGGVIAGVVLIANPWGMQFPIEALGTLVTLAAIAIWRYPEAVWSYVSVDETVHKEFGRGGAVVEVGDTVRYEPPDDRDPIVFEEAETTRERLQRATVYGALDTQIEGPLPETEPGVLPTEFASRGERTVAAYRYAVHDESPTKIASDMDLTQQKVVYYLANTATTNGA